MVPSITIFKSDYMEELVIRSKAKYDVSSTM